MNAAERVDTARPYEGIRSSTRGFGRASTIDIQRVVVRLSNAAGHEHRVGPIAQQAARMLALRIQERAAQFGSGGETALDLLTSSPLQFDLAATTDHDAATHIAEAWFETLAARLENK